MRFVNESECVFRGFKELTGKESGKPFTIVTVSDPIAMETKDFFPPKADLEKWKALEVGETIRIGVDYDGKYTNIILL